MYHQKNIYSLQYNSDECFLLMFLYFSLHISVPITFIIINNHNIIFQMGSPAEAQVRMLFFSSYQYHFIVLLSNDQARLGHTLTLLPKAIFSYCIWHSFMHLAKYILLLSLLGYWFSGPSFWYLFWSNAFDFCSSFENNNENYVLCIQSW